MKLEFTKMHGCGNDYIYFDCFKTPVDNPEELSVKLSDRHFSIGGDGIVLICPSDVADAKMRMFNIDGSEGKMCGNAIRCVGKYIYDTGIAKKPTVTVETLSGIKTLSLIINGGICTAAKVNMGKAILDSSLIPCTLGGKTVVGREVCIAGTTDIVTCVSMGNPHCVVFRDNTDDINLSSIGPKYEFDPLFPERVNTEFVKVIDKNTLQMRVWERGSGETWACGTGACASAVAAVLNGFCKKGEDILVHLKGGDLIINYTDDAVFMTGPAEVAFTGTVEI